MNDIFLYWSYFNHKAFIENFLLLIECDVQIPATWVVFISNLCLKFLMTVGCICDISENDLGVLYKFTNYLKEMCKLGAD